MLHATATGLHADALRQVAASLRDGQARASVPSLFPQWFTVVGTLGSHVVWAGWAQTNGLSADPWLLTQAHLLADLGEVFVNDDPPARVEATVKGCAAEVMMTLAQACDEVTTVEFG